MSTLVRITVRTKPARSRTWGRGAYRAAGRAAGELLAAQGWEVLRLGASWSEPSYLRPPAGHRGYEIAVMAEIPTRAEIEALAVEAHARGDRADYQMGIWPAYYAPAQGQELARFFVGDLNLWGARLVWKTDDARPTWREWIS